MQVFPKNGPGRVKYLACLLAWFLTFGASVSASAQVISDTSEANAIFSAYTNAFYRLSVIGPDTYFQNTQTGGGYTTFWEETEEIECFIDAYEWTTNASYKAIITNLLNGFTLDHGTQWLASDGYNDDVMWSVMDFARGGMDTGMTNFCNIALYNFTNCYARAWSTNDGGGLWWKYPDNDQKNACVNGPGAIAAYLMYQIYGNTNFWEESSNIYFWERSHLYNGSGKIYDHLSITNGVVTLNTVATTYNQGTFIGAANFLGQLSDAVAAANYTKNSMGSGGIMPQYGIENNNSGFNAIFFRWMMRFIRDNGLQSTYQSWLKQNANVAWNLRRTSDNLSWCQWLQQTPATNLYSWDCISSFEAIEAMPPTVTNSPTLQPQVMVVSGNSYTISAGTAGSGLSYQWYAGGTAMAGQTNETLTVTTGTAGSSVNYYVVITDAYGAATSSVSTVTAIAQLTNPYATNILQLNPAGYWPMHEVEAAARGDIETNYGTLGLLGTGYYPDWAGATIGIQRGIHGALANDNDTAVNFTRGASLSAGTYTNVLFVPHNSPLSTLNPPFSVECWFFPTNTTSEDIWAQCGDEGLNAGGSGNGGGTIAGVRLLWENGTNTGFQIFNLDGTQYSAGFAGNVGGPVQAYPTNNWYHLVLTCDAGTNFSLYINGAQAALTNLVTGNGPGTYSPDYWSPLTIGGGRGGTRAVGGYIDEFAVYTNVIDDISNHYSDGVSGAPGAYFHDVTNDNPVVYLRMDAPAAYSPAVATWPILFNYGSSGGSGNYTPGTVPGILPGPDNSSGAPYGGVTNNIAMLSGVSSFADAGFAPAFNPTGANANFSVMAIFRGNPCDGRIQSVVGHGTNSWQLTMITNGCLVFNAGNGNHAAGGTGQSAGDMTTTGVYNDGNWHQVVAVNQSDVISIYVDGVLDTNGTPNGVTTTSVIPGNTSDVMIGSDQTYTNTPAGVGWSFDGQICEVALFTNALTSAQVQGLYLSASIPLPETLRVTNVGSGSLQLNWSYGLLQCATNVCGPYVDMTNAVAPYVVPMTNQQQFFRLKEN